MCWINVSFFASDERPDARGITDSVGGPPRTLLAFVRLPFDILFWSWRGISLTQSSGKLCDVKCLEHYFVQMHVLFCIFERSLIHWNGVIYIKMLRPLSAEFLWVIIVFSRCISLHITDPCTDILKHFVCISVPRIRHKLTWKYFMWAYVHPHPPPRTRSILVLWKKPPTGTLQSIIVLPKSPRLCWSISVTAKRASQWLSPHTNLAAFQRETKGRLNEHGHV